jgi:UDPglucose--hexose-1-phosphate uridylyltransferase
MTPTFRRDRLTGQWRLVAPTRAGVPLPSNRAMDPGLPSTDGRCPFCPGHEEDAGHTVARLPSEGAWQVRVVRNKYPALVAREDDSNASLAESSNEPELAHGELDDTRLAFGAHEVVVETRAHEGDLHELSIEHLTLVLRAYRDRVAHHEAAGAACVLLFRNRGVRAGSTQAHPHAQVVASSVVPTEIARRARRARAHFEKTGARLIDAELRRAEAAGRVVLRDDVGSLVCPHAPSGPYETWLIPHHHVPFARLDDDTSIAIARLLQRGIALTLEGSGRRAWNLLVHLPPLAHRDAPHAFWHVAIVPRGGPGAGLELVSGTTVVTVAPEDAAARLRALAE